MKATLLTLLLASASLLAESGDYVNFLRQTQFSTGLRWDMPVSESGRTSIPYVLGKDGSFFELWSLHLPSNGEIILDQRNLGQSTPTLTFEVETGDPYPHTLRTRVDQPFTMRMTAANFPVPVMTKMFFAHRGVVLPEGELAIDPDNPPELQFSNEFAVGGNGVIDMQFPASSLTGPDATKIHGVEYFTVGAIVNNNGHGNNEDDVDVSNGSVAFDPSGDFDDETLVGGKFTVRSLTRQKAVQVWPVADGAISGIEPGRRYQRVPSVRIDLHDLYPDSTTWVRLYQGSPGAPVGNPVTIGSATVVINDSVPQDRTLMIDDLGYHLKDSGSYTMEVLHQTPFGTEVLTRFTPLVIDWNLSVNGTLYSGNQ